jgi:type II secretory pathway pseudopilin PulG
VREDDRAAPPPGDRGYIMVALLVGMAVSAVWMSAMLPTWRHQAQRDRETELIFRGEQYARAIALYAMKNNGALPAQVDDLVAQGYLRRKWKDPITGKDFQLLGNTSAPQPGQIGGSGGGQGQPLLATGIRGVFSESPDPSIRVYNNAQQYNQWIFDYQAALLRMGRIGGPGAARGDDGRGRSGPGVSPGGGRSGGPGRSLGPGGDAGRRGSGGDGRGAPGSRGAPGGSTGRPARGAGS